MLKSISGSRLGVIYLKVPDIKDNGSFWLLGKDVVGFHIPQRQYQYVVVLCFEKNYWVLFMIEGGPGRLVSRLKHPKIYHDPLLNHVLNTPAIRFPAH